MSFSRSIAEIANSSTINESSLPFNQREWEHRQFRDKSLGADSFQKRKSNRDLSQVDKAYRKLGQQLSLRAHGSFVVRKNRTCCTIGREGSSFTTYNRSSRRTIRSDAAPVGLNHLTMEAKAVPKGNKNYQKTQFRKRNLLRHFTMNASKLLRVLQDDMIAASANVGLTSSNQEHIPASRQQRKNENISLCVLQEDMRNEPTTDESVNKNRISLPQRAPAGTSESLDTPWNRHKHSKSQTSIIKTQDHRVKGPYHQKQPGKCLTDPFISASNNGFDNANGDLIVFENDVITVLRNKIHVLAQERMRDITHVDYRVQRRLGQGTFAQVFQCCHMQTGKLVALKIVKNKAAYARQASIEIDVLRALGTKLGNDDNNLTSQHSKSRGVESELETHDYMVDLVCYFLYKSHLCLVFELLGKNLYDILKQRNFRGLQLSVVRSIIRQAVHGIAELAKHGVVHCDIKPENVLLADEDDTLQVTSPQNSEKESSASSPSAQMTGLINTQPFIAQIAAMKQTKDSTNAHHHRIKLIDFGSACFEGQAMQAYVQSRFYRSPEVLIGLPFDSAIDIWSLGCVAAELFLGLPILPGAHEHDQLGRILEMISSLPDWMLDQGSKASTFFTHTRPPHEKNGATEEECISSSRAQKWTLKSQTEFISSLSEDEIRRKGGLIRMEKQRHNRYFKKRRLSEVVLHKGQSGAMKEHKYDLDLFVHFLYGLLDPDPRKRWTAVQASQHPFLTGSRIWEHTEKTFFECRKSGNLANLIGNLYWEPPLNNKASGSIYSTFNKSFRQHGSSISGNAQMRYHLPEQFQSNESDFTAYQRVPNFSATHGSLSQSFDKHETPNLKNDKTSQFHHQNNSTHPTFSSATRNHNGGQPNSASNGQIQSAAALLQKTQSTFSGHLKNFYGDKRDNNWSVDASSRIGGIRTSAFSTQVSPQYNQHL